MENVQGLFRENNLEALLLYVCAHEFRRHLPISFLSFLRHQESLEDDARTKVLLMLRHDEKQIKQSSAVPNDLSLLCDVIQTLQHSSPL